MHTTRLTVAPDGYDSDPYAMYNSPSNSPSPMAIGGAAAGPASTLGTLVRFLCRRKCLKHALSIGALMLILSPALLSLLYPQLRPGYVPPNAAAAPSLGGADLSMLSSSEDADSSHPSRERTAGELKAHLMSRAHLDWNELDWKASAPHVAWAIPVGGKTERLPQLENLVRSLLAQGAPLSSIHIFEDTGSRVPSGPSVALGALAHKLGVRLHDSAVARLGGEERREEFGINLAKHYAFMMDTILLPPAASASTATAAAATSASSRATRSRTPSGRALSSSASVSQGYGFNSDPSWSAGSFGLGYRHVVFLEDDLVVAPDAVKYFLSFSNLLEVDTSIFCVSAHNDNAFRSTVRSNAQAASASGTDAKKLLPYDESLGFDFKRGGHFMAPGFMISARVYSFLRPMWFDRGAPLKPKRGSALATTTPPSQWTLRYRKEFRMPNGNWDAFLDSRVGSMECIYPRIPRIAHRGAGGFTVSANTQAELYDNLVLSDVGAEAVQYGDLRRMEQSHYRSLLRNFIESCLVLHSLTRLRHESMRGQRVCILVPSTSDADSVWTILFTHVLGLVSVGGHAGFGKQRGVHEGTVLLELLDNQVLFIGLHSHYRLDVALKMQQDRDALLESLTPRAQAEAAADFIADGIGIKPLEAKVLSDAHSVEYLEIMGKLLASPAAAAATQVAGADHQARSLTGSISAENADAAREILDAAAAQSESPLFDLLNQNLTDASSSAHFLSLGCFHDGSRSSRDLSYHVPRLWPLTPMRCVLVCELLGFRFAGVQWGHECWCGNHYGRFSGTDAQGNAQQRRAQCDAPCANDEAQQKREWRIRRWQQSVNIQRQGVNNPFDASAPSFSSSAASSFTPPFSPHSPYSSESTDEGGCGGAMSNSIYSVFHPPLEGLEAFPSLAHGAPQQLDHDHPPLPGSAGSVWNGATDSVLSLPRHMLPPGVHFVAASHVQAKEARAARAAAAAKSGTQAVAGLSCDEVCVAFGTEQREHPYRCSDTLMPLLAQNCPALQRMLGCASCQTPESALEGFAAPGRLILPPAADAPSTSDASSSSACILSKGKYERCDWAPADSAFVRACVCTRVV